MTSMRSSTPLQTVQMMKLALQPYATHLQGMIAEVEYSPTQPEDTVHMFVTHLCATRGVNYGTSRTYAHLVGARNPFHDHEIKRGHEEMLSQSFGRFRSDRLSPVSPPVSHEERIWWNFFADLDAYHATLGNIDAIAQRRETHPHQYRDSRDLELLREEMKWGDLLVEAFRRPYISPILSAVADFVLQRHGTMLNETFRGHLASISAAAWIDNGTDLDRELLIYHGRYRKLQNPATWITGIFLEHPSTLPFTTVHFSRDLTSYDDFGLAAAPISVVLAMTTLVRWSTEPSSVHHPNHITFGFARTSTRMPVLTLEESSGMLRRAILATDVPGRIVHQDDQIRLALHLGQGGGFGWLPPSHPDPSRSTDPQRRVLRIVYPSSKEER